MSSNTTPSRTHIVGKSYCSILQTNFFKVALFLRLCFINYTLFANEKGNIYTITLVSYPVGSGYEIIKDLERGKGGGGMSLESRIKFPYIHESHNFLKPLLVTMNV